MRIQVKITLLVFFAITATLAAVTWRTSESLKRQKLNFMADTAMKQVAPLKRLVQERLEEQKSRLVKFAIARAATGKAPASSDFEVISLVQPVDGGQWTPSWVEKSASAKPQLWPAGYEQTLLKSLPYGKVKDGETVWTRVSDQQGSPLYAVMISVEIQNNAQAPSAANNAASGALPDTTDYAAAPAGLGKKAIIVGFASADPLADVTEDYIGSTNTVFLVDDKGYVAAHVNRAYLGALFSEDQLVQEIVNTHKTAASGTFEDLEGHGVLGHFERIDRTNLYAVMTTPLEGVTDLANDQLRMSLSIGGASGLIFVLIAWLLSGRMISQPIGEAVSAIKAINRGEALAVRSFDNNDEIGALMRLLAESSPAALASKVNWGKQAAPETKSETKTETKAEPEHTAVTEISRDSKVTPVVDTFERLAQERRAAYQSFNEGFSSTMKEPLLAILGHAQLTKAKADDPEVRSHAESIEREARRAKDLLDRLEEWGSHSKVAQHASESSDPESVVRELVAAIEDELKADGVQLTKDIHAVPELAASREQLKVMTANLIENAREAMRERHHKKLKVQLDFLNDCIYLVVSDTGVGMTRDVKEKMFEPFFKSFESPHRMGLGLAIVSTMMKNLGGAAEVETSPGEGTTITLRIPVDTKNKEAFLKKQGAKIAAAVAGTIGEPAPSPSVAAAETARAEVPPPLPPREVPMSAATPPPPPKQAEPPAGASVTDLSDDDDLESGTGSHPSVVSDFVRNPFDDDDDDDDQFANVALGPKRAGGAAPSSANEPDEIPGLVAPIAPPLGSAAASASASSSPSGNGFEVKIRRPKARS